MAVKKFALRWSRASGSTRLAVLDRLVRFRLPRPVIWQLESIRARLDTRRANGEVGR